MRKMISLTFLFFFVCCFAFAGRSDEQYIKIRFLTIEEKVDISGGFSSSSLSSGKGGTTRTSTTKVEIKLDNVPYYCQNDSSNTRSQAYCGLASAMMVRNKGSNSGSSFYRNLSQSQVNSYMKAIDDVLNSNNASNYFGSLEMNEKIDITKFGLLFYDEYMDNTAWYYASSRNTLYSKTKGIINDLYTSWNLSGLLPTRGYVNKVYINVATPDSAIDAIWNHIKNNREPVVVIMDSKTTDSLNNGWSVSGMTSSPVLHYEVIVGIYQESSNAEKYFYVHDPWKTSVSGARSFLKYKASDYVNAMAVNSSASPNWLYEYASNNHGGAWYKNGCYYMLINN